MKGLRRGLGLEGSVIICTLPRREPGHLLYFCSDLWSVSLVNGIGWHRMNINESPLSVRGFY